MNFAKSSATLSAVTALLFLNTPVSFSKHPEIPQTEYPQPAVLPSEVILQNSETEIPTSFLEETNPLTVSIESSEVIETNPPTVNSFYLSFGEEYTFFPNHVTMHFDVVDTESGLLGMRFSTDNGGTWIEINLVNFPQPLPDSGISISIDAPNGDGVRTVQAVFFDFAGNETGVVSDTIIWVGPNYLNSLPASPESANTLSEVHDYLKGLAANYYFNLNGTIDDPFPPAEIICKKGDRLCADIKKQFSEFKDGITKLQQSSQKKSFENQFEKVIAVGVEITRLLKLMYGDFPL